MSSNEWAAKIIVGDTPDTAYLDDGKIVKTKGNASIKQNEHGFFIAGKTADGKKVWIGYIAKLNKAETVLAMQGMVTSAL